MRRNRRPAGWLVTAILLAALGVHPVGADCLFGTPTGGSGGILHASATAPLGQSFVACQDGLVSTIAVWFNHANQSSILLGFQHGTDILAPTWTRMETVNPLAARMVLHPYVPVTAGETYSFSLTPAAGVFRLFIVDGWEYTTGTMLAVEGGVSVPRPFEDLQYTIEIVDPPVPAGVSTWGEIKATYR